jgi:hypothetical protein
LLGKFSFPLFVESLEKLLNYLKAKASKRVQNEMKNIEVRHEGKYME